MQQRCNRARSTLLKSAVTQRSGNVRQKSTGKPARSLSGIIAGGAVAVGIAALVFGIAPQRLSTATAAATPSTIRFSVNEGTNISITRPTDGQSIIMDLHGFLYRVPGAGGQASRI